MKFEILETLDEVKQLVVDIKNGQIKPIYFLMGEEPYYIDRISDFIEKNVLSEEEKAASGHSKGSSRFIKNY